MVQWNISRTVLWSFAAIVISGCVSAPGSDGPSMEAPRNAGIGDGEFPEAAAGAGGTMSRSSASGGASAADFAPSSGASDGVGDPSALAPVIASSSTDSSSGNAGTIQSGILTAGAWDDNLNFDHFSAYRDEQQQQSLQGMLDFSDEEHTMAHNTFAGVRPAKSTLDVSLVIDTTGSMGDEIQYLQTEFKSISSTIEDLYPDAQQRWSLVLYRDMGDEYVARWFDFRDNADDFRDKLAAQSANGGGDFPEAPEAGFEAMNQLAWRTDDATARLAFWVADAPHHEERAAEMASAIRDTQGLDVHIYPVASSGVDELTELSMRSAAQITGGRYLFLTDDSGVGGEHKEPSIPCYFVTRLDQAILRMVDIELSGEYREPDAAEVIRTGGDPSDGACTLESGEQVQAF